MDPVSAASVIAIGVLTGWTELAQRYRDSPTGPLKTWAGWTYIGVNGAAALGALWLVRELKLGTEVGLPKDVAQVLLAGAGAMAFFRSSFFTIRVGDKDLPLGPAAVLQVILNAADRAYDRQRAAERSAAVSRIMANVSFDRAKQPLTAYCITLMQNVGQAEATRLGEDVQNLEKAAMGPRSKASNLGLLLMGVVGEETLETAVKDLASVIFMPNDADAALLKQIKGVVPADGRHLLALCKFLDPDTPITAVETEITTIVASTDPDGIKVILMTAALRRVFGSIILEAALQRQQDTLMRP